MVDATPDAELQQAIELLFFGYREFTRGPDRILERRGLGRVHHRILYFVARRPRRSVGALLEVLGVTKQALSAPLRQLTAMGLVELTPGQADRRVKQLALTDAGTALEAELTGVQTRLLSAAFTQARPRDAAAWARVMRALAKR